MMASGHLWPRHILPRHILLSTIAATILLGGFTTTALADEQRASRLGLALYVGIQTLSPDFINNAIDEVNAVATPPPPDGPGLAPLDHIAASPIFQIEGRFFISDKFVATLGYGTLGRTENLTLQPQTSQEIIVEGSVNAKTLNTGLDYYFTPYTSGDVTWRPFAGAGFMSVIEGEGRVGGSLTETTPDTTVDDRFDRFRGQGAGFYLEAGVQLMIPSRYSFIANVFYRNLKMDNVWEVDEFGNSLGPLENPDGSLAEIDLSGIGLRVGINIDILDRF